MKCPFCGSKIVGKEGNKVCKNMFCRAYQVNDENYDKSLSRREYERRLGK